MCVHTRAGVYALHVSYVCLQARTGYVCVYMCAHVLCVRVCDGCTCVHTQVRVWLDARRQGVRLLSEVEEVPTGDAGPGQDLERPRLSGWSLAPGPSWALRLLTAGGAPCAPVSQPPHLYFFVLVYESS